MKTRSWKYSLDGKKGTVIYNYPVTKEYVYQDLSKYWCDRELIIFD